MQSIFYPREARCKICNSTQRDPIDERLLGNELKDDGTRFKLEEIVLWAEENGLETSISALSRHRNNHLNPAIQQALETERVIEAISAATGRKLSLPRALANALISKVLRLVDTLDWENLDSDQIVKLLDKGLRAGEVLSRLERADITERKEIVDKVDEKLKEANVSDEVRREVRKAYGLE